MSPKRRTNQPPAMGILQSIETILRKKSVLPTNMVETRMEIDEGTANAVNLATHVIEETSVDEPDEGFAVS
jgi:hypothetical protein